ncbi:MAG: type II toxin-antitoxin system HicB family antitoxin [Dehalococcoidia bacterium]|nr:type II toxin-antitoxin system HicB family antitoxin [Dehalococcoidia bacterium]
MRRYTVILSPDPERGGFTVSVPAMPGAVSQGDTRDETLANIREAMEGWLAVARDHGEDALHETPQLVAKEIAWELAARAEEGWDLLVETAVVELQAAAAAA